MKKILLSFVLSIVGFIGFSFASSSSFSFTCSGYSCNPGQVIFPYGAESFVIKLSSTDVEDPLYSMWLKGSNDNEKYFNYSSDLVYNVSDFGDSISFISFSCSDGGTQSFNIDFKIPVVAGGVSNFTPVIDGLSVLFSEFIPYVVYISIGFLVVVLGFYAIKWLVNWLSIKITKYFK